MILCNTAWIDFLIVPPYLLTLYLVVFFFRSRIYDATLKQHFLTAFNLKIIGGIGFAMVYTLYYTGGDTTMYWVDSMVIYQAFLDNPPAAFTLIFGDETLLNPEVFEYTSRFYFRGSTEYAVVRFAAFIGIFTFANYTTITIFFAALSFSGVWALYRALYRMYPHLHRQFAFACFYIPSVFFWGSGLMKDTLTFGAMGWIFYGIYFGIIRRQAVFTNILIIVIAGFVIFSIKKYQFIWVIPSASLWIFLQYRKQIRSRFLQVIIMPFVILAALPAGYWGVNKMLENDAKYNLNKATETAEIQQRYLSQQVQSGSAYNIGVKYDGSISSFIQVLPFAVWLGLFRPHPWEFGGSPIQILTMIECLLMLYITIRTLINTRLVQLSSIFTEHPLLLFCLTFSIIAAFTVALTSGNYGTLVRYRFPLQPFYLVMLYIIRFYVNKSTKLL